MELNEKVLDNIEKELKGAYPDWERLIEICFLSDEKKEKYLELLTSNEIDWIEMR